jgi:hypothetical protein
MNRIGLTIVGLVMGITLLDRTPMADSGGATSSLPLPALTAEWWQWAASIPDVPDARNPTLDTTGASCMVGQRGSVWFLAGFGAFGPGGSVIRACSIPEGTTLFFPVINSVYFNTPACGQNGQSFTVKELRQMVKGFIDIAQNLSVTVDSTRIQKGQLNRVKSIPFEAAFPVENFFGPDACAAGQPLLAGIYSPSVDDGYYASIPPLKPGEHVLHFHAESNSGAFVQDVTYNLTVVPVLLK